MEQPSTNLPSYVRIDLCTLCQLNCVECFMRKREKEIKAKCGFGYVNFDTFRNFVDKHPFIKHINTTNHGELFLNPDLDKIMEYAYKKGISLSADAGVNLNRISVQTAENLVRFQFEYIVVSIDGASQETYEIYRRGGNFNRVINNIKMINQFKEMYKSDKPRLEYKFIPFGHNEHEIEKAKELAKSLNMDIKFEVNYAPEYSPLKNPQKVREQTLLTNLENNLENFYNQDENTKEWFFCNDLFTNPQIAYNGELRGCCRLVTEGFGINVFEVGLEKALNSERVLYARKMLTDFKVPPRKDIPCSYCQIYKMLKSNNKIVEDI